MIQCRSDIRNASLFMQLSAAVTQKGHMPICFPLSYSNILLTAIQIYILLFFYCYFKNIFYMQFFTNNLSFVPHCTFSAVYDYCFIIGLYVCTYSFTQLFMRACFSVCLL